ncbi:BTB/POZ domain-containing protein 6-like [Montipora capricornis]|uniref:BTB/POZ domain-containing protein 6-like n=1 Tax=Montipora capricornis TaxID=246305 RepID=UPI0035F156E4
METISKLPIKTKMYFPENRQTTRPTIRERTKFMLNNDLFSDVKFVVRKSNSDDESESKQVIPAHKFVLSISSPVFEAMFYGELAETSGSIELPDCEYNSLLELFRFMYSDEVHLSGSNVMEVFYLAKKYMVPSLVDKCSEYVQSNLQPSNVLSILPLAEKYDDKALVDRCWKVIDTQSEEVVTSDGFATIQRSFLEAIISRDTLTMKEIDLFKAIHLWATKQCKKRGLETNGEAKRGILGEAVVKKIRFPLMKEQEFATVVLDANILTLHEVVKLVKFFNSALVASAVGFPETKRSDLSPVFRTCDRFNMVNRGQCWDYRGKKDFLTFSVNNNIKLHGMCLFGSINNDYHVKLVIKHLQTNYPVKTKTGNFRSQQMEDKVGTYFGFEIVFDTPLDVEKNTDYKIEALISGPSSGKGNNGRSLVDLSGVQFTFKGSAHYDISNGTCLSSGQFPRFVFSL